MRHLHKTFVLTTALILFSALRARAFVYSGDSTVNAETLITHADRAMLYIVKAAQDTEEEKLKRSSKESEPFWAAVKKLNTNVDKLIKYNFLKDEAFHKTLAETVTAKEEVLTTYELLEVNDARVKEGIDKVSSSIDLLYQNYSKEAMRAKNGEALSAEENEKLDQLKSQNQELLKKLDELEAKVSDNKQMLKKIKKIKEKSTEVVHCHNNSAGFFFAMSAMHMINGWMWGCHWWWGPWGEWYPGFYFNYVDIYVNVIDYYAYDWGYLDGVIDAYEYELELELELELVEMEAIDEYLDEVEIESELYQEYEQMYDEWDGMEDVYDNSLDHDYSEFDNSMEFDQPEFDNFLDYDMSEYDDFGVPTDNYEPMFEHDILEAQPFDQMDFGNDFSDFGEDFSDFDFGGFDEW